MTMTTNPQSPEITGAWDCKTPGCFNRKNFIGIDAQGYGGPEACEGDPDSVEGCPGVADKSTLESYCACVTELVQPFTVLYDEKNEWEPGNCEYEAFTGGESDAEIGSYTKIVCAECRATLWEEEAATMPKPLFSLPEAPAEKPRCFACGNTGEIPTVAVFVRGGLVQDVHFDGSVRVVVIDFDTDNEGSGIYRDPDTGKHSYVDGSMWERSGDPADDRTYVRAAVQAFADPIASLRDNEEERARIHHEMEEDDDGC
jgi:hypothetical protein